MNHHKQNTPSRVFSVLLLMSISLTGCASPPSVMPLLRITQDTLRAEAGRLNEETARDRQTIEQTRRSLEDAFVADLREQRALDPAWVNEATTVYVAVREALLAHEMTLRQERLQRADNLLAAEQATQRAIDLLEQRDQLLTDTSLARLWRRLSE